MVTITVKENSKQAKKFLEYVETLPFVEFKEKKSKEAKIPNNLKASKEPKGLTSKDAEELFDKLNLTKKEKAFYRKFRKAIIEAKAIEAGEMEGIPLEKTLNEI